MKRVYENVYGLRVEVLSETANVYFKMSTSDNRFQYAFLTKEKFEKFIKELNCIEI